MRIIADDKIPFLRGALEGVADVVYLPGASITNEVLSSADALITRTRTKCDAAALQNTSVKMIATATIGFDHIDTLYCEENGIEWTNAPGCNAESVKQYVASAVAMQVLTKGWNLNEKSIAVVGVGNVGSKVAAMAEQLGMTVYRVDPPRARNEGADGFFELKQVIHKADIVTFHTPLISQGEDKTFHLCDSVLLSKMKKGAVVVNSSRGEVICGDALKETLTTGKIGGAVLDVWENEPGIDEELLQLVDIATPHIAGYSQDGKANGTTMSVRAISKKFGLGLDDWEPSDVPLPDAPVIRIDCYQVPDEEVFAMAFLHTYQIMEDDERLRESLATFEKQRGDYPVRREFSSYEVELKNGTEEQKSTLLSLGFARVELVEVFK